MASDWACYIHHATQLEQLDLHGLRLGLLHTPCHSVGAVGFTWPQTGLATYTMSLSWSSWIYMASDWACYIHHATQLEQSDLHGLRLGLLHTPCHSAGAVGFTWPQTELATYTMPLSWSSWIYMASDWACYIHHATQLEQLDLHGLRLGLLHTPCHSAGAVGFTWPQTGLATYTMPLSWSSWIYMASDWACYIHHATQLEQLDLHGLVARRVRDGIPDMWL